MFISCSSFVGIHGAQESRLQFKRVVYKNMKAEGEDYDGKLLCCALAI